MKLLLIAIPLLLASGCSDDNGPPPPDTRPPDLKKDSKHTPDEGVPDAGPDADAALDAKPDTLPDTLPDPDLGLQPDGTPHISDNVHTGWKQVTCPDCHTLPEVGHTADKPWQCAYCHGGNGACNPNGVNSMNKFHAPDHDCYSCHPTQHPSFDATTRCASCHYASAGTEDCPL